MKPYCIARLTRKRQLHAANYLLTNVSMLAIEASMWIMITYMCGTFSMSPTLFARCLDRAGTSVTYTAPVHQCLLSMPPFSPCPWW